MQAIFLGTGTSVGVPVIACDCAVCTSPDPRNRRRRTSLYVTAGGTHILVDTPPDFREQALAYRMPRVDAVLFTHAHADHIFGFDDIRRYNTIQDGVIPAYAGPETLADLQRIFNYIGTERVTGFYRPRITFQAVTVPFAVGDVQVTPVPVEHGAGETLGFVFEYGGKRLGYVPDCHAIPETSLAQLGDLDVMILDALRHRPHRTHLTVTDSVALLARIAARQSYLIHLCHEVDHGAVQATLPAGVAVSYDGLAIDC